MRDLIHSILNEVDVSQRKRIKYSTPKKKTKNKKKGDGKQVKKNKNANKTLDARAILSKKHGFKKAIEKEGRQYVLDYLEIEDVMEGRGYEYDPSTQRWVRAAKKTVHKDDEEIDKKAQHNDEEDKISFKKEMMDVEDPNAQGDKELEVPVHKEEDPEDELGDYLVGLSIDFRDITEEDLMSLIGRLVLFIKHKSKKAIASQGEEYIYSNDLIIEQMVDQGYGWSRDRQAWLMPDGRFPIVDEMDENEKSITGRALATLYFNDPIFVKWDARLQPERGRNKLYEIIEDEGFVWDAEDIHWDFPPDNDGNETDED